MIYISLFLGLLLLVAGGDVLVRGAVALAQRMGVSPLMIGLTLVGFGTSTPELVTSLQAAAIGAPGIALGNVIGSNIANILLILGIAAVVRPMPVGAQTFGRDGGVLVLATGLCAVMILGGALERLWGFGFLSIIVIYILVTYRMERGGDVDDNSVENAPLMSLGLAICFAIGGIALTIVGARILVDAAISLAQSFGVSETVIGLTIVAVGTSLPELVTAVMAALRGQADVALGNVIGSNIYNVFAILGITAIVTPITVPADVSIVDVWVMILATLLFLIFAWTGRRITRGEGAVFLAGYGSYIGWLAY